MWSRISYAELAEVHVRFSLPDTAGGRVRVHHYLQSACHLKFYRPTLPDPYPLVGNFDLLAGRKIW